MLFIPTLPKIDYDLTKIKPRKFAKMKITRELLQTLLHIPGIFTGIQYDQDKGIVEIYFWDDTNPFSCEGEEIQTVVIDYSKK